MMVILRHGVRAGMVDDEQFKQTLPLQEAIDVIQKELNETKNLTLAQIELHKLTLRVFLDLGVVELESLVLGLRELQVRFQDREAASELFEGLVNSFEASHGQSGESPETPHLRLVRENYDPD